MSGGEVRKRCVFFQGGYEPMAPARQHERFVRELGRFARTWNVATSVSDMSLSDDGGIALGAALQKYYGLSREGAMFFIVHGEEDKEHSKIGEYLIEKYATTPELRRRVWLAARRGLGVFNNLFDGIWEAWGVGERPSVLA